MYISQSVAWHRFQGKTSGFTTAAESGVHRGHCFFSRNYPRVCHFIFCLFFNQHLGICCSVAKSCPTLWPHVLQPPRLLCPWDFLGQNSGAGGHFLLWGIFPPRDRTYVSCLADEFFNWATWEPPYAYMTQLYLFVSRQVVCISGLL